MECRRSKPPKREPPKKLTKNVDQDGDFDLVVGNYDGDLTNYYENTGNPTNPAYTRRLGVGLNPFHGLANVGSHSAPAFVDKKKLLTFEENPGAPPGNAE